jgi:sec-independent protein translocase protein TatA
MPSLGPMELIIILVIALIVLGPKRLPDAGRSLGRGMREFKDGLERREETAVANDKTAESPAIHNEAGSTGPQVM